MSKKAEKVKKALKITLTKSYIGYNVRQKRTLYALGLRRISQTVVQPINPAILGMVKKVEHLVTVEEVENDETA
jgi:large subunit ribosomal protein L30